VQLPPTPVDESRRLSALHALDLLDTPPDARFDAITRAAAGVFGMPVTLLSLVDESRQWFKSRHGLEAAETPRDISFCGHAILSDETFIVEDALADARFTDNPLVTGKPHVRFYAGRPLATPDGARIGTLCLIDSVPRKLTAEQRIGLNVLGAWAEAEIALVAERRSVRGFAGHLLERTAEAVLVADEAGLLRTASPAALQLLRRGFAALSGLALGELVAEADRGAFEAGLEGMPRAWHQVGRFDAVTRLRCGDGAWLPVTLCCVRRNAASGAVLVIFVRPRPEQ
jgi:GAF domain-containing protein